MRRFNSALVILLALVFAARAQWIEKESRTDPGLLAEIEHRHLVFDNSDTGDVATIELALFSTKSYMLRVLDQPAEAHVNLATAAARNGCLAAVNGGYFDEKFAPLGLRIIGGRTTSALLRDRLLSGVLASNGAVHVLRVGEFSAKQKLQSAIQCGPFLVDPGRRVRGLEATHEARRTFAAVDRSGRAALGYCSEISLAQLSAILAGGLGDFKIQRALNLDGGSSSAFWCGSIEGAFSIPEQKPVRDFVGIIPDLRPVLFRSKPRSN